MTPSTIRTFLVFFTVLVAFKVATAPKRGKWLTLFGNVNRADQPRMFWLCMIAGIVIAVASGLAAIYTEVLLNMAGL